MAVSLASRHLLLMPDDDFPGRTPAACNLVASISLQTLAPVAVPVRNRPSWSPPSSACHHPTDWQRVVLRYTAGAAALLAPQTRTPSFCSIDTAERVLGEVAG